MRTRPQPDLERVQAAARLDAAISADQDVPLSDREEARILLQRLRWSTAKVVIAVALSLVFVSSSTTSLIRHETSVRAGVVTVGFALLCLGVSIRVVVRQRQLRRWQQRHLPNAKRTTGGNGMRRTHRGMSAP